MNPKAFVGVLALLVSVAFVAIALVHKLERSPLFNQEQQDNGMKLERQVGNILSAQTITIELRSWTSARPCTEITTTDLHCILEGIPPVQLNVQASLYRDNNKVAWLTWDGQTMHRVVE